MNVDLKYLGRSEVRQSPSGLALSLAPNLARPQVFFDAQLRRPLRFREAISALHDVVVGDLRFKKKDKTAYEAWKQAELLREQSLRERLFEQVRSGELDRLARAPRPPNLDEDFRRLRDRYWRARSDWQYELRQRDPEMFRHLVPYDPVITVAPDVVLFECFSKDESSYGCLTVERDAFDGGERNAGGAGLGTTNVDYSLELYQHFQTLRSYRPTRLLVDPTGFEVKVQGNADYREEKIDLPASWLRGFGQLQAAMGLPCKRVVLPTSAVYSLLVWLKRNREKTGPRSIRFQLTPGRAPTLVLDPWGTKIECPGVIYDGAAPEEIKVWGRRRLMVLARLLPLAERFEVRLLGSGLPSIWVAHLGEMRFQLALSGWTTNDWAGGANLELLADHYRSDDRTVALLTQQLVQQRSASLASLVTAVGLDGNRVLGGLHQLARQGQVVYDFAADRYRWRQVMPMALSEEIVGPPSPAWSEGQRLVGARLVKMGKDERLPDGRRLLEARIDDCDCAGLLDADQRITRARCNCRQFAKTKLRGGPCRHLVALRLEAQRR